jgi:hypothetical protein
MRNPGGVKGPWKPTRGEEGEEPRGLRGLGNQQEGRKVRGPGEYTVDHLTLFLIMGKVCFNYYAC